MPDNINLRNGKAAALVVGEPAWHGLGTLLNAPAATTVSNLNGVGCFHLRSLSRCRASTASNQFLGLLFGASARIPSMDQLRRRNARKVIR